jgi:two-component system, OmpR family, phosphate regulon sensor histidine kinase PhoR
VRRDFVANVSHELRTPISVVAANAETLRAGALADPPAAARLVDAIDRNATRLSHLVDDLLDLSRLESGAYRLEAEPIDVTAAVRLAIEGLSPKASARRVAVETRLAPGLLASADGKGLAQILVNLIGNAIKYTQEGGHVAIEGRATPAGVRVEVIDDGPGIPPDQRDRIFERFYRIDPGRSRDMGGTGLGLAIVRHLVDAMHGAVGVTANHPRGAIFWIELPAA